MFESVEDTVDTTSASFDTFYLIFYTWLYKELWVLFMCVICTSEPWLKYFWISGIRNLMEASASGKRRCFLTHTRTSSGLTRSPTLCWAIKLNNTHTHTQLWYLPQSTYENICQPSLSYADLHNEVSYAVLWQCWIRYAAVLQVGQHLLLGVFIFHHVAVVLFLEGQKLKGETHNIQVHLVSLTLPLSLSKKVTCYIYDVGKLIRRTHIFFLMTKKSAKTLPSVYIHMPYKA